MNASDRTGQQRSEQCELHAIVKQFTAAWQSFLDDNDSDCKRPKIQQFLHDCPANERESLFWELLNLDLQFRRRWGTKVGQETYEASFRDLDDVYRQVVSADDDSIDGSVLTTAVAAMSIENCLSGEDIPKQIGRYKVRCLIGGGGFGRVYRAYDSQLDRDVAIKVPRKERGACLTDPKSFESEARIIAKLEHPHIVPVFDFGVTDDGRGYIVSKWVEGSNLAAVIERKRPDYRASADIVIKIAAALQVAHRQKITHRDIKPANILMGLTGEPFVTDFGLAISHDDFGDSRLQGMTPAYASPEQARGEGHLVDGRSDIFSLGVVFYELLTGERPFGGKSTQDVLDQILAVVPRPPRQIDPDIPQELERICLQTLAKRATDRYSTAFDLMSDLTYFLQEPDAAKTKSRSPNIFISYRREDSLAFVHRLCERLQDRYGDDAVFLDMISLRHGLDIRRQTDNALQRCDVVLAVIGPDWAGRRNDRPRHLDDQDDYVRIEVETALACGLPVVPVLVGTTPMPTRNELPESLNDLSLRHACSIDAGRNFDADIRHLIESLDEIGRDTAASIPAVPVAGPTEEPEYVQVFPKGLHSFDESDADFFLRLLPGPTNRDGLTESISFWKNRIEQFDPDRTFRVGLLYGPSGCGKSSLVKAGLRPRLGEHVRVVYVESTASDTEAQLLRQLNSVLPKPPAGRDMVTTLAAARRGKVGLARQKILIVLDQFEQWLHAHRGESYTELLRTLRHCDGQHVQALLMVRDEYWMPATRFMQQLEIPLNQGQNWAAVDLFDTLHARRVLTEFGRGYGRLPDDFATMSDQHHEFLDRVVDDLTNQDDKIVSVHLALFADMVKNKPWTPDTLEAVGGAKGVGVTFLKETFTGAGAPPVHRLHQKAARAVMKRLLPESGSRIKGSMCSEASLLAASGYAGRQADFDELMRILITETRLVTPADPESYAVESDEGYPEGQLDPDQRYYQLTHDYLVPSVGKWLNVENRATLSGRAFIRLEERSESWAPKQDNRQLPTLWETLNISLFTRRNEWTDAQRKMIAKAERLYGGRLVIIALLLAVAAWIGIEVWGGIQVKHLGNTSEDKVLRVADSIGPGFWAKRRLQQLAASDGQSKKDGRLYARLALVRSDGSQIVPLLDELAAVDLPLPYVGVIREALQPYQSQAAESLWGRFHDPEALDSTRFRTGLILAALDPNSDQWTDQDADLLVKQFFDSNPAADDPMMLEYLKPIKAKLLRPIERVFTDSNESNAKRYRAAIAASQLGANNGAYIGGLLAQATVDQFEILFPLIERNERAIETLRKHVRQQPEPELERLGRLNLGRMRARAAISLLRNGDQASAFQVFELDDDPESLTQFVHRGQEFGVTPDLLLDCLDRAEAIPRRDRQDPALYGLLLALGHFDVAELQGEEHQALIDRVEEWYERHPTSRIHGASGWLLRNWGFEDRADRVDQTPLPPPDPREDREWFVQEFPPLSDSVPERDRSYMTFVVFENPEASSSGGPQTSGQPKDSPVAGRFAVMDREVTTRQWNRFQFSVGRKPPLGASKRAATQLDWYSAVEFCRWLTQQAKMAEEDQYYVDPSTLSADQLIELPDGRFLPKEWPTNASGRGFRLLTVSEWVHVCESGMNTEYSFGSDRDLMRYYAWFVDDANAVEGFNFPQPVGMLRPNLRGVFDMYGNVYEWCHDTRETKPAYRYLCGGSFLNTLRYVTTHTQDFKPASDANSSIGFRVALSLP